MRASALMAEVGAQEEEPLTLTQIGNIRKNFLAEAKIGGTSRLILTKIHFCLDPDIFLIKLHNFGKII